MNSLLAIKDKVRIRNFTPADRDALRQLCSDTAFMGEPVEKFMEDRELFADWASAYYTDYEPRSIFLAEYDKGLIGYIMGARREQDYEKVLWRALAPGLILKSSGSFLLKHTTRVFFLNLAASFLRGEFKRPDFSKMYPAHLHINVDKNFRGLGAGSLLMNKLLGYLSSTGIKAVRLATLSRKAAHFFEKSGFNLLYRERITYFDYLPRPLLSRRTALWREEVLPQENLHLHIYGKML